MASQDEIEEELIEQLKMSARLDDTILYLFYPRTINNKKYRNMSLPENIILIGDFNLYEAEVFSDFHLTVNSTFALESLFLGTRNILLNIKNMSQQYYGKVLENDKHTRFANSYKEVVHHINDWPSNLSKEDIRLNAKQFFELNHQVKLEKILNYLEVL